MLHAFSRTELLIGKENLEKLKRSRVAIFGIGGVGSFAVEGLVRAGVGRLVLIDDDTICLTNLNRQLHATIKTIGKPKVAMMRERILEINPEAQVTVHQRFYMPETADTMLAEDFDYMIDAMDTVSAKVDLVVKAKARNIPIISAMGAGNKLDPSRFQVADIYATSVCPLARVMRKELKHLGIPALQVVYSKEEPIKPLPSEEANQHSEALTIVAGIRSGGGKRNIPGSISFVPSVVGLILAGTVVKDLIGQ